ncbi:MAG: transglutaminase domain-containing protein [bacterium]|nr:transglutaminase domain-containing protein [bacterium]
MWFLLSFLLGVSFNDWSLIDSVSINLDVSAGNYLCVKFDAPIDSLEVYTPPDFLTPLSKQAVAYSPGWLRIDLVANLSQLDSDLQDQYATMILDAPPAWVDELSFQVAHIPSNILSNPNFYPEVITENTKFIYQADSVLAYADIIDYGGADYYSTVRYRAVNESGDTIELEYPKEYYYWYIVHPKISRELCTYINPNTGDPSFPPTGKFWRDYLFNQADAGYPVLRDYFTNCSILWGCLHNDTTDANGAVAKLNNWMRQVMVFQSPSSRKYQPVHIYHQHRGTCTEWGILTAAAARACLIPTVRTSAYGDNHHWNEFYESRWVQWEPVNKMIDNYTYDPGWWQLAAAINWRGDGYTWTVSERYTPFCTLTVKVIDVNQDPVDGAFVAVRGGPNQVTWYCAFGYTNSAGECSFTLGDLLNYDCRVTSSIGEVYWTPVITNSQGGEHYSWTPQLDGVVPSISVFDDTLPESPQDEYKVAVNLDVPQEAIYGNNPDDNSLFIKRDSTGNLEFFICDSLNFTKFVAGSKFLAFLISKDISTIDTSFVFPTSEPWYLIVSNKDVVANAQSVSLRVELYKKTGGIASVVYNPSQNLSVYPNPFNQKAVIRVQGLGRGLINQTPTLQIYDLAGRLIKSLPLITDNLSTGFCESLTTAVAWDGTDSSFNKVPSGIYFLKLKLGPEQVMTKLLLLR